MSLDQLHDVVVGASVAVGRDILQPMAFGDVFEVECRDRLGRFKWKDTIKNLVVNVGLDDVLDEYFKGSSYSAAHYVGLTDSTPTVNEADTMASHAGWVEVTAYDEANRPAATWGTVASQSVDNSASKATFTISTNATTVGGAFICTNNTRGGSTGILYGAGAFTGGDKVLDDNDVLYVTVTASAAAS